MTEERRTTIGPGDLSAVGAAEAVATGSVGRESLMQHFRERHDAWEPALGAVVGTIDRRGLEGAPLDGVLMGVKDSIAVKGFERGTLGFLSGDRVGPQPHDAVIVERLLAEGVRIVARTALPSKGAPAAMTPQTGNPRALDRIAGGSSGGSSAAVAAGLVHAAIGTDSGGSIRIPAACCGVVGLNPTYGLIPGTGINSFVYSIASTGPIASSVEDATRILNVIAGEDASDPSTTEPRPDPIPRPGRLRIGVLEQVEATNLDDEVRSAWRSTLTALEAQGAALVSVSLDRMEHTSVEGPRVLGIAESAGIIEDIYRADPSLKVPDNVQSLFDAASRLSGSEVARTYALSTTFRADVRRMFESIDVLVLPTLPCRIPSSDHPNVEVDIEVGGVIEPRVRALTRLVNPWNFSGVPAGTVPVGRDSGGAPIGMQVVGPWYQEHTVLGVMGDIETIAGGPWDTEPAPA
jgi:aspartyl-tRNA(Asn)/glutamyl-tRNA(Gln) amidotransferase subunit A